MQNYKVMKEQIIKFLRDQKSYEATSADEYLIDELIKNIKIANETFDKLGSNYTVESNNAAGSATKVNPLFTVYNAALKNIDRLYTKLNLSPQDRAKLKIIKEDNSPLSPKQMELKFHNK